MIKSSNEDQRAENDLIAQSEMSTWAFWMLWVTIGMAAITALGVYFVWRTLIATQDMSKDTKEIGIAQVRAYLTVIHIDLRPSKTAGFYEFEATIKNEGQTPARRLQSEIIRYFSEKNKGRPKIFFGATSIGAGVDLGSGEITKVCIDVPQDAIVSETMIKNMRLNFAMRIRYRDTFGRLRSIYKTVYLDGSCKTDHAGSYILRNDGEHTRST